MASPQTDAVREACAVLSARAARLATAHPSTALALIALADRCAPMPPDVAAPGDEENAPDADRRADAVYARRRQQIAAAAQAQAGCRPDGGRR